MSTDEILPVTKQRIPAILGFDVRSNAYTIGDVARLSSLSGKGQMQDQKASRVSLAISRFDGNRYNRLSSEPITLREIGYRDGELLFFLRDEVLSFTSVRYAIEDFL